MEWSNRKESRSRSRVQPTSPLMFESEDESDEGDPDNCAETAIETKEQKILKSFQTVLMGIPPPPAFTVPQLDSREILKLWRDNHLYRSFVPLDKEKLELNKKLEEEASSCKWPDVLKLNHWDVYYNSSSISEEVERLSLRYKERYVGVETSSCINALFVKSPTRTASARKRARNRAWGHSPGRRLSHLARRRKAFSSANLRSVAGGNNPDKKMIMVEIKKIGNRHKKKNSAKKTKPTPKKKTQAQKNTYKRALFQSPDQMPVEKQSQTPNTQCIQRSKRNLFMEECIEKKNENGKRERLEEKKMSPRKRVNRSLSFHDHLQSTAPTVPSVSVTHPTSNTLSGAHKQKMLWAATNALREEGMGMNHELFRPCMTVLFKTCQKLWLARVAKLNEDGSTSERMLALAKKFSAYTIKEINADPTSEHMALVFLNIIKIGEEIFNQECQPAYDTLKSSTGEIPGGNCLNNKSISHINQEKQKSPNKNYISSLENNQAQCVNSNNTVCSVKHSSTQKETPSKRTPSKRLVSSPKNVRTTRNSSCNVNMKNSITGVEPDCKETGVEKDLLSSVCNSSYYKQEHNLENSQTPSKKIIHYLKKSPKSEYCITRKMSFDSRPRSTECFVMKKENSTKIEPMTNVTKSDVLVASSRKDRSSRSISCDVKLKNTDVSLVKSIREDKETCAKEELSSSVLISSIKLDNNTVETQTPSKKISFQLEASSKSEYRITRRMSYDIKGQSSITPTECSKIGEHNDSSKINVKKNIKSKSLVAPLRKTTRSKSCDFNMKNSPNNRLKVVCELLGTNATGEMKSSVCNSLSEANSLITQKPSKKLSFQLKMSPKHECRITRRMSCDVRAQNVNNYIEDSNLEVISSKSVPANNALVSPCKSSSFKLNDDFKKANAEGSQDCTDEKADQFANIEDLCTKPCNQIPIKVSFQLEITSKPENHTKRMIPTSSMADKKSVLTPSLRTNDGSLINKKEHLKPEGLLDSDSLIKSGSALSSPKCITETKESHRKSINLSLRRRKSAEAKTKTFGVKPESLAETNPSQNVIKNDSPTLNSPLILTSTYIFKTAENLESNCKSSGLNEIGFEKGLSVPLSDNLTEINSSGNPSKRIKDLLNQNLPNIELQDHRRINKTNREIEGHKTQDNSSNSEIEISAPEFTSPVTRSKRAVANCRITESSIISESDSQGSEYLGFNKCEKLCKSQKLKLKKFPKTEYANCSAIEDHTDKSVGFEVSDSTCSGSNRCRSSSVETDSTLEADSERSLSQTSSKTEGDLETNKENIGDQTLICEKNIDNKRPCLTQRLLSSVENTPSSQVLATEPINRTLQLYRLSNSGGENVETEKLVSNVVCVEPPLLLPHWQTDEYESEETIKPQESPPSLTPHWEQESCSGTSTSLPESIMAHWQHMSSKVNTSDKIMFDFEDTSYEITFPASEEDSRASSVCAPFDFPHLGLMEDSKSCFNTVFRRPSSDSYG